MSNSVRRNNSAPYEPELLRCLFAALLPPREQPPRHVNAHDYAALVTGEEAAQPLHTAFSDDVLVLVARQQADGSRCKVWRGWGLRRRTDLRPDSDIDLERGPIGANVERHKVVLVIPDDLAGPRLVIGKWLLVLLDDAQVGLHCPTENGLIERDPVRSGVGQRDDSKVSFRHKEQLGELTVRRPTMPDGAHAVYVA